MREREEGGGRELEDGHKVGANSAFYYCLFSTVVHVHRDIPAVSRKRLKRVENLGLKNSRKPAIAKSLSQNTFKPFLR